MIQRKILAISGSTRQSSSNLNLIKAITELFKDELAIELFEGLTAIPHFNPDLDTENPPLSVIEFRNKIKQADGILICTPEYAMGVPGTLKNAIDWTVSSCEFSKKPVVLITASSLGQKAHISLLETLRIIESDISDDSHLLISHVKTKVSKEDEITDLDTMGKVKDVMGVLIDRITK